MNRLALVVLLLSTAAAAQDVLTSMCTNSQELQNSSNGTTLANGCIARRRVLVAASDTASTSTSFANVTDLTWTATATTTYTFYCRLIFTSSALTTGIAYAINGPTSSLVDVTAGYQFTANGAAPSASLMQWTHNVAFDTGTPITDSAATGTNFAAILRGTVTTTDAGTLAIRVASEVGGSSVSSKAGSWCLING